jgi:hypothetical protein
MGGDAMATEEDDTRDRFEQFTASSSWRSLPLKIKLMLLHIWRAERDVSDGASTSDRTHRRD